MTVMNYLLILGSAVALSAVPSGCKDEQSQYDYNFAKYVDGRSVEVGAADNLVGRSVDDLSVRALEIHQKAIAVFMASDNESLKVSYISAFPDSFDEFLTIFHPSDFAELYSGSYTYLHLYHQLGLEYPRIAVPKYLSLAKNSCFDADAPNQFRENLRDIRERFPELYQTSINELSEQEKRRIELLDQASIHDWEPKEAMCGQI